MEKLKAIDWNRNRKDWQSFKTICENWLPTESFPIEVEEREPDPFTSEEIVFADGQQVYRDRFIYE